ncbi:hypothetical protein MAR_037388 [Mya arenaria]|uniref:Uncharacterized protein n=1 Tax=Mya arenaria TaxID=6604 RepID=A0ABY7FS73_MYAAR|nr:hypothetical protein MAR_037388 [Mya arenaria]
MELYIITEVLTRLTIPTTPAPEIIPPPEAASWWSVGIGTEERTQHELLFFSQGPVDGYLSGCDNKMVEGNEPGTYFCSHAFLCKSSARYEFV